MVVLGGFTTARLNKREKIVGIVAIVGRIKIKNLTSIRRAKVRKRAQFQVKASVAGPNFLYRPAACLVRRA